MSSSAAVIGVDSSTQSTKAVVVEVGSGRVLASGRAAHTVTGSGGARESDPEQWWRALVGAVGEALGRWGRTAGGGGTAGVAGIAVAGQQHGLVVLDGAGRPLRPALLWNDTRSAPQAAALTRELGVDGWLARAGSAPVASMTAAKWRWLVEHEPRVAEAAAGVRLPHDYLTERLSGTAATDPGDASGTLWYSTADHGYDPRLLEVAGLERGLLPEVAPSGGARVGSLTAAAAAELGLPAGVAVAAGTGDNMAAAVGLGLGGAGLLDHPVVSLGTSGTVFAATRTRPAVAALAGFAAADGQGVYLPLGCTLNCTLAVDRVAELLGLGREDAEPGGEAVLLPYLDGERTPDLPAAAGLLTGLRHATSGRQVLGAAYEGAVFTVLRALEALPGGVAADAPLRLTGGGARGRMWVETVRRLSGRPVVLPRGAELVALGAAALAAGASGAGDPVAVAVGWGFGEGRALDPLPRDERTWQRIETVLRGYAERLGG
ncbi:xylulokinase [Streptomyces sp. ODS05-4]|uniref:xylulokinase n=1 Tax=Streptomyces sp. ODS05-4 TaxID=2944939 RepID=UPI00210E1DCF|nr:xylulokinase [Streptomyces sp. ODS05-4]